MTNFPALDVRKRAPVQASRVLVIKPKQTKKVVGQGTKPKNVWDKVASAANVANNTASRPSSAQSSVRSSPQSSRPSSPVNTYRPSATVHSKTPWSGSSSSTTTASKSAQDFPSLKPKTFPALPSAAPKHQMILNMRRQTSGQSAVNAWSSGGASSSEDVSESAAEDASAAGSSSGNKKKKGRKNNVLFRVGL